MAYLHHHKIVYRDLKPHNVLIFSLSLSIVINAKICDFGIARYATLYGLKSSEGTPGYRAPEVARGDVGYNKKADMYSFGMLLYELVTGGKRPFEDLRFRNELDAAVMQGRMVDPITDYGCSPWPDVDDLIQHLLEPRADMRPTADQVKTVELGSLVLLSSFPFSNSCLHAPIFRSHFVNSSILAFIHCRTHLFIHSAIAPFFVKLPVQRDPFISSVHPVSVALTDLFHLFTYSSTSSIHSFIHSFIDVYRSSSVFPRQSYSVSSETSPSSKNKL